MLIYLCSLNSAFISGDRTRRSPSARLLPYTDSAVHRSKEVVDGCARLDRLSLHCALPSMLSQCYDVLLLIWLLPCNSQIPHGAYFIMVDASSLRVPDDFETTPYIKTQLKDFRMAYFVAKTCDVVW
jgi:hypothetical protein